MLVFNMETAEEALRKIPGNDDVFYYVMLKKREDNIECFVGEALRRVIKTKSHRYPFLYHIECEGEDFVIDNNYYNGAVCTVSPHRNFAGSNVHTLMNLFIRNDYRTAFYLYEKLEDAETCKTWLEAVLNACCVKEVSKKEVI